MLNSYLDYVVCNPKVNYDEYLPGVKPKGNCQNYN